MRLTLTLLELQQAMQPSSMLGPQTQTYKIQYRFWRGGPQEKNVGILL